MQAGLFLIAEGHAFIPVVGQRAEHKGRLLADWQHAALLRADGHASAGVGVDDTTSVFTRFMHGAVDHKAGRVDGEGRVDQLVALLVHFDQAAGGDLVKHQPIGVDQKMVLGAGDAGADVGEHQVTPAIGGHQAVARCQIDTQLPFFGADLVLERRNVHGRGPLGCWTTTLTVRPLQDC